MLFIIIALIVSKKGSFNWNIIMLDFCSIFPAKILENSF